MARRTYQRKIVDTSQETATATITRTDIKRMKKLFNETDGELFYSCCDDFRLIIDNYYKVVDVEEQKYICQMINDDILPKIRKVTESAELSLGKKLLQVYDLFFLISCRRNLRNFAFYLESFKTKKVWEKTAETFSGVFHYCDKFVAHELDLMRISCMPGLGKSYMSNLVVAHLIGNNPNITILRITYSDDLVKETTKQVKSIIDSQAFRDVFPVFRKYDGNAIFRNHDNYSFCVSESENESSYYAVTRDGQATGKRAKVVVIDDILKGALEANNYTLHERLKNMYDSDWSSRADDDNQLTMIIGTMWSNTDLLNVLEERAVAKSDLLDDIKYPYTQVTEDNKSVFIAIPALDDKGNSTCESRFSTKYLANKRDTMSPYLWQAVYQQSPIASDGLEFANDELQYYYKKPDKKESRRRRASLDPARKGRNYVSMPVFYEIESKHHLVDFLYEKKSMKELYPQIVNMVIKHELNELLVENNTDTSLKLVIDSMLRAKGYLTCEVIEKYSTENKEKRIKDYAYTVKTRCLFPDSKLYNQNSGIGRAIKDITVYSFEMPNKYDDAIDSVVLYCMQFVENTLMFAKATTFSMKLEGRKYSWQLDE